MTLLSSLLRSPPIFRATINVVVLQVMIKPLENILAADHNTNSALPASRERAKSKSGMPAGPRRKKSDRLHFETTTIEIALVYKVCNWNVEIDVLDWGPQFRHIETEQAVWCSARIITRLRLHLSQHL